nr:hypothetical protein DM860_005761 [Ipomoea batatas]
MFVGKSYQPAVGDFGCWSALWSICMPTNIKNFIWRCTRGILLVCAMLLQHRVHTDGVCVGQLSLATSLVPPPLGFLKCWFNAVLDASPSKVSFKMVLFNGQGAFARACNDFLMCVQDPNLANALACKEALAWLKGNGLYNIVL